jgi:aminopeptidase N
MLIRPMSMRKMGRRCISLALLCLAVLCACTRNPAPGASAPQQVATGMAVLNDTPERPLYTLNVTLDYANNDVHAQERIEFRNPTGAPVSEIKFNVPLAHRRNVIDVRDARIFGQAEPISYVLSDTVLTVRLPAPLPASQGISLAFDFTIKIPIQEVTTGIGGDDSSHGLNSLTAGHWYIMLAPYLNGDWDTPSYIPIGDPYVELLADYEVTFLAPEGIVIAGGGEEQHDGRLWRFTLPQARVFAFSASDIYQVDTLEQDGITYIHYAYPKHRKYAEDVLYTAARAVKLYTQRYGPYPYQTLRIVETDRTQGQEYSGMVAIGTTLYEGYSGHGSRHDLIATTAHEVSHQWWFQQVGNDQVRTPWLDEAFARLSELYFYQTYYPQDVDWWYKRYITQAGPPKGGIDLPIYAFPTTQDYIAAVYRRGLVFLNTLRNQIGADDFDAAVHDYYMTEVYRVTTPDAFFAALARHTSQDLSPLVKGYFASQVVLPCKISANAPGCR